MQIELIHGDAVFDRLAGEWDGLARQGMTDTPFQHLAYQRAWWRHLQPQGATLHTVATRDGDGQLQTLACLYLIDGVLYFNGCVEETDYLDILAPPAVAAAGWEAVFDCLCDGQFPAWRQMELCNVPEASATREILPRLAARRGLQLAESIHEVCPVIQLPDSFDTYLESLDSKQRREIRRKLRRAAGADAALHIVTPDEELAPAVDAFLTLLAASTLEKEAWLNEGRRAVFHETARAAREDGSLLLMFMSIEGQKASALFNFDYKNRIYVYNSGLDPLNFGPLSLGEVLTARAVEWSIEQGRTAFDFLRGEESYKYRFGAVDTRVYRLELFREP